MMLRSVCYVREKISLRYRSEASQIRNTTHVCFSKNINFGSIVNVGLRARNSRQVFVAFRKRSSF